MGGMGKTILILVIALAALWFWNSKAWLAAPNSTLTTTQKNAKAKLAGF